MEFTATPDPDDFVLTWLGHCAASPAGDPDNPGVEKTCAIEPGLGDVAVAVVFGNIQTSLLVAEVMKDSPNLASVAALLNDGANPNQPSDNLAVPVMHAVARNASIAVSLRADIVSVLITAGADPDSRDASGPAPRTVPHLMAVNPPDGTGVPYSEALEVLRHFDAALAQSADPGHRAYVWWRDVQDTGTDSPSPLDILVSRRESHPAQQSAIDETAAFIRSKGGLCQTTPNSDFAPPICLPPPAANNFHAYAAAGETRPPSTRSTMFCKTTPPLSPRQSQQLTADATPRCKRPSPPRSRPAAKARPISPQSFRCSSPTARRFRSSPEPPPERDAPSAGTCINMSEPPDSFPDPACSTRTRRTPPFDFPSSPSSAKPAWTRPATTARKMSP